MLCKASYCATIIVITTELKRVVHFTAAVRVSIVGEWFANCYSVAIMFVVDVAMLSSWTSRCSDGIEEACWC